MTVRICHSSFSCIYNAFICSDMLHQSDSTVHALQLKRSRLNYREHLHEMVRIPVDWSHFCLQEEKRNYHHGVEALSNCTPWREWIQIDDMPHHHHQLFHHLWRVNTLYHSQTTCKENLHWFWHWMAPTLSLLMMYILSYYQTVVSRFGAFGLQCQSKHFIIQPASVFVCTDIGHGTHMQQHSMH